MFEKIIYEKKGEKYYKINTEEFTGKRHIIEMWDYMFSLDYGVVDWVEYTIKSNHTLRRFTELVNEVIEMMEDGFDKLTIYGIIGVGIIQSGLEMFLPYFKYILDEIYNEKSEKKR